MQYAVLRTISLLHLHQYKGLAPFLSHLESRPVKLETL